MRVNGCHSEAVETALNIAILVDQGHYILTTGRHNHYLICPDTEHQVSQRILNRGVLFPVVVHSNHDKPRLHITSSLVLSPGDRGRAKTFPLTLRVVQQRRQIAAQNGTAYWSVFDAMGGPDSMLSFKRRGLAEYDYTHFTEAGGAYLGDRLIYALWRELDAYLGAHPEAGCTEQLAWD